MIPKGVLFYCPIKLIHTQKATQVQTRSTNLGLEYMWIPCDEVMLMPKYEERGKLVPRGWKFGFNSIDKFFDEILSERVENLFEA
jgi:hypothetical protein